MASSTVRPESHALPDERGVSQRLLESAAVLAYDPATEVDWETPLDRDFHGASPEWSTLYGTAYWAELTEDQRKELTRQEAASVASTGIWFEMILQQMVLRDMYAKDPTKADFQWALTEVAEECRHSIMFARGAEKLGAPAYRPHRFVIELGRVFKTLAFGEAAYAAILVAEEVLDVMQRDWMRDERVVPFVRTINNIHVVEESRHMKFARDQTRRRLAGAGRIRRRHQRLRGRDRVLLHRDEHGPQAGLRERRAGRAARRGRGRGQRAPQVHDARELLGPHGVPGLRTAAHQAGAGVLQACQPHLSRRELTT